MTKSLFCLFPVFLPVVSNGLRGNCWLWCVAKAPLLLGKSAMSGVLHPRKSNYLKEWEVGKRNATDKEALLDLLHDK
jgi:hypothetical protein